MKLLEHLHADKSKIDVCTIRKFAQDLHSKGEESEMEIGIKQVVDEMETVVSTRVPNETFRGIVNFYKAFLPRASQNDIENALVS